MSTLLIALIVIGTALAASSVAAVYRATHKKAPQPRPVNRVLPHVTVLKPLRGADDSLESNLETFFLQDYPRMELLFGIEGEGDPAAAVVRRLAARYPGVCSRLVIHEGGRGLNPKVSNLRAMLETPTHDVVVISDSNIAVRPDYVRRMVDALAGDQVGVVTNLIRGVRERSLGATFENLQLIGPVAGGVAASAEIGRTITIGKSMMFRRSDLQQLGGMESVATLLAEDYVIGRMFRAAGYRVALCDTVVDNVCEQTPVRTFARRHMRWGLMRSRLKPLVYPFELLSHPFAIAAVAPLLGATGWWPLLWALGVSTTRDGLQWLRLRGTDGLGKAMLLVGPKEVLMLGVWLVAPFRRHVSWRGRRYRVSAGTRLYDEGVAQAA